MSRSYKKTPIIGYCSGSEKDDKIRAHKKFRRKTKQKIFDENSILPTKMSHISDNWDWVKDGKQWLNIKDFILHESLNWFKKLLRK